jgi:sugar/nucleoside kinase (ribokinase family)
MSDQFDVSVAGQLCLDLIPEIPDSNLTNEKNIFVPGKLIHVGPVQISTGGPVSNAGIALAKMGLTTSLIARIGDDEFGKIVTHLLHDKGCSTDLILTKNRSTSYTIVIAPPNIDRMYLHGPGANGLFTSEDLNKDLLSKTKLLHFGYPPSVTKTYENEGEELLKLLKMAKSFAVTTSMDMTLPEPNTPSGDAPWFRILQRVLPYVDIFLPSIEEIFLMFERENYLELKTKAGTKEAIEFIKPTTYTHLAKKAIDLGAKIVCLKTGFRGLYLQTNSLTAPSCFGKKPPMNIANWSNRELWCPAFRVSKIASATGSGDSACAGFLAAYFNGCSAEQTLKYANCLGYQNLQEYDGTTGILDWHHTTKMIEHAELEMIDIPQLNSEDWRWETNSNLWIGKRDNYFQG